MDLLPSGKTRTKYVPALRRITCQTVSDLLVKGWWVRITVTVCGRS